MANNNNLNKVFLFCRHCLMQKAWLLLLLIAPTAMAQTAQLGVALTGSVFTYTVRPGDSLTCRMAFSSISRSACCFDG